jgi:hypothetical protein
MTIRHSAMPGQPPSVGRLIDPVPITQRLRRVLGPPQTKADVSDEQWTLCPAEAWTSPPAIFNEADLGRITAYQENTKPEIEEQRIRGRKREQIATVAFRLRGATLIAGQLYKDSVRLDFLGPRRVLFRIGSPERIKDAVLVCSPLGNRYFGHFMTDDLPLNLLGAHLAEPVTAEREPYLHESGYRVLTGLHARPLAHAWFESLLVIDDLGQNRLKRERFEAIRATLNRGPRRARARGVFVRRGGRGAMRELVNQSEIERYLARIGFEIIDPERCSPAEFVARSLGAEIAIGVEGSQLAPAIFTLASGGTMITLIPPDRFNNVFKDYVDCLDMRYAFTVGRQVESGFRVEVDDLARLLERL